MRSSGLCALKASVPSSCIHSSPNRSRRLTQLHTKAWPLHNYPLDHAGHAPSSKFVRIHPDFIPWTITALLIITKHPLADLVTILLLFGGGTSNRLSSNVCWMKNYQSDGRSTETSIRRELFQLALCVLLSAFGHRAMAILVLGMAGQRWLFGYKEGA